MLLQNHQSCPPVATASIRGSVCKRVTKQAVHSLPCGPSTKNTLRKHQLISLSRCHCSHSCLQELEEQASLWFPKVHQKQHPPVPTSIHTDSPLFLTRGSYGRQLQVPPPPAVPDPHITPTSVQRHHLTDVHDFHITNQHTSPQCSSSTESHLYPPAALSCSQPSPAPVHVL